MPLIEGTTVWHYTMSGTLPPGVSQTQAEAVIRSAVMWSDSVLSVLRGSVVQFETLTPDELARRMGRVGQ